MNITPLEKFSLVWKHFSIKSNFYRQPSDAVRGTIVVMDALMGSGNRSSALPTEQVLDTVIQYWQDCHDIAYREKHIKRTKGFKQTFSNDSMTLMDQTLSKWFIEFNLNNEARKHVSTYDMYKGIVEKWHATGITITEKNKSGPPPKAKKTKVVDEVMSKEEKELRERKSLLLHDQRYADGADKAEIETSLEEIEKKLRRYG